MTLSENVRRGLEETFIAATRPPREAPTFATGIGGHWFCPRDGVAMIESDGVLHCSVCSRSLNEFVHQLIELHPHRDDRGHYR